MSNKYCVIIILEISSYLSGNIQIIHSPQTVTNATIGGTVTFQCVFSGTIESPSWNINGEAHYASELRPPHMYDVSSMSLIISPVESGMNNSVYYCFFVTYSEMESRFVTISSEHATLIIQPVIYITSQQMSSNSVLSQSVVPTHTVCRCGKTLSACPISPATTTTSLQFHLLLSYAKSPKLTGTNTVQSCNKSTVLSNFTNMIDTVTTSDPRVSQNLPVQGCNNYIH